MSNRQGAQARNKPLLAPIHLIFGLLQQRATVSIWLYEQLSFRIEGKIRVRGIPQLRIRLSTDRLSPSRGSMSL